MKVLSRSVTGRALVVALGLSVSAVALILTGPVAAQTALSSSQLATVQVSLNAALKAAGNNPAAIKAAIAGQLQQDIATYGAADASVLTSALITLAEQDGVPPGLLGAGLAQAAVNIGGACTTTGQTLGTVGSAIASTLANVGNQVEIVSFESTSTSLGCTQLASIAGSSPTVGTGSTGSTGNANGGLSGSFSGSFSGGPGNNGGCLTPSCTSL